MAAYWIARARVDDPEIYKGYADQVPGILAKYGGAYLARGGAYQVMEGPEGFGRFVIITFPRLEDGVACFESEEYQKAAAIRRDGGGVVEIVLVDGVASAG